MIRTIVLILYGLAHLSHNSSLLHVTKISVLTFYPLKPYDVANCYNAHIQ